MLRQLQDGSGHRASGRCYKRPILPHRSSSAGGPRAARRLTPPFGPRALAAPGAVSSRECTAMTPMTDSSVLPALRRVPPARSPCPDNTGWEARLPARLLQRRLPVLPARLGSGWRSTTASRSSYRYRVDPATGARLAARRLVADRAEGPHPRGDVAERATPTCPRDRDGEHAMSPSASTAASRASCEAQADSPHGEHLPLRLPSRRAVLQPLLRGRQHHPHAARRAAPRAPARACTPREFLDRYTLMPITKDLHLPVVMLQDERRAGEALPLRRRRRAARSTTIARGRAGCTRSAWRSRRRAPASSPSRSTSCSRTTSARAGSRPTPQWTVDALAARPGRDRAGRARGRLPRARLPPLVHRRPRQLDPKRMEMFYTGLLRPRHASARSSSSRASSSASSSTRSSSSQIAADDEALLRFAFRWLRFALFGEPTMTVRGDAAGTRE